MPLLEYGIKPKKPHLKRFREMDQSGRVMFGSLTTSQPISALFALPGAAFLRSAAA